MLVLFVNEPSIAISSAISVTPLPLKVVLALVLIALAPFERTVNGPSAV